MKKKLIKERIKPHLLPVEERKGNFKEVNLGYTEEEMLAECERCLQCEKPLCIQGCPCHCNIKEIIRLVLERKYEDALELVYSIYVFPRSIDRVCPHFCENTCVIGKKGDPVQIMLIKRYLADHFGLPPSYTNCAPNTEKHVAVVGSGPAGLTTAFFLAKRGHTATVFEKLPVLGGLMRVGIPEFRLPKKILQTEIDNIKKLGVKFKPNTPVEETCDFDALFSEGFNAIFLGIGAHAPKWMKIPGENLDGSIHALDFLREFNLKGRVPVGDKVAVIGGGNSAIDSVRVAKRLGSDSFILYRRHRNQMPANPPEIIDAEEEGIPIHFLTNPIKILGQNNKVSGLECLRMKLGEPDSSGRPRPIPIPNSNFTVEADMMIQAISQEPDIQPFSDPRLKFTRWKTFEISEEICETPVPGVFAGGDCIRGIGTVVEAVRDGKQAVRDIHAFLSK
ncbi:MAG: NAD(P)-dependent oxidoreductase [Candidatus Helarchaeota archaeon]|nr:NAD(P)-dependent oxidoreductase [Candidatus Helarchaeota archaeon]